MKVKSILENIDSETFIEDYLSAFGIKDIERYVNPTIKELENPFNYIYMDRMVDEISEIISKKKDKIYILQDSDVDGLTSAVIFYRTLTHFRYPRDKIEVLFHRAKEHGINKFIMPKIDDNSIVVIPDASCEEGFSIELKQKGCVVYELDHHLTDIRETVLTVNNHDSFVKNTSASGAVVTWKFVHALCSKFNDNYYKYLVDLAMLGNISDVMSMLNEQSYENRLINKLGLTIRNDFFNYLVDNQVYGKLTPDKITWDISPLLNAVSRMGEEEDKQALFYAFAEDKDEEEYETILKKMKSIKSKQDRITKKAMEDYQIIDNSGKIVFAQVEKGSTTGLVANKLLSKYRKPIVLLTKSDTDTYMGSVRSNVDLRDTFNESGLFIYNNGHSNVFGTSFKKDKLDDIIKYSSSIVIEEEAKMVAYEYKANKIDKRLFGITYPIADLFVCDLKKPMFYISDIVFNSKDITFSGRYDTTINFVVSGVKYTKSYCSKVWKQENGLYDFNKMLKANVIGELVTNEYGDRIVAIANIEFVEYNEEDDWDLNW